MFSLGESALALNANPQQLREHLSLGVTERRELGCDALNGAMPLAQLYTGRRRVLSNGSSGCGETIGAQGRRQFLGASGDVRAHRAELCGVPRLEFSTTFAGKLADGTRTDMLGKEPQRRGCQFGIIAFHPSVTDLGENVCAGGPTSTTTTSGGGLALLDGAVERE